MAQSYSVVIASGSTSGRPITLTGTASGSANLLHTAASTPSIDEVYIAGSVSGNTSVSGALMLGGATSGDFVTFAIVAGQGVQQILAGHRLGGGLTISAFATPASVAQLTVNINRITTS